MNSYLQVAIDLALNNIDDGGTPYGAVVVCDGKIIGQGANTIHQSYDVSGHAELIAIRQAQQVLQSNDLKDCDIYASGHPCPMCLGAIGFVGISKVYYANTLEEASHVGMGLSSDIYQYLKGHASDFKLEMIHLEIPEGELNPMTVYNNKK